MKVVKLLPLLLVLLIIAAGCATLFDGTRATVNVTSTPASAAVEIKLASGLTIKTAKTPAIFSLAKKNTYIAVIKMEGYQEQSVYIDQRLNNWFFGNLCLWGVVGMAIDYLDGAMWHLEPNQIHVELVTAMQDGKELIFAVIGAIDDQGQLRTLAVPMIPIVN
jgi:hypothetical protein